MLWGVSVLCVDLHGARFSLTPVLRFHEPSDEVETEPVYDLLLGVAGPAAGRRWVTLGYHLRVGLSGMPCWQSGMGPICWRCKEDDGARFHSV